MMNATAVLPASAAMAFAGNAATISDSVISDNSAPGGFSDMLGAMVAGNRQSAVNAADARTEGQTAVSGEILSGLTELEQSAEELKQLLKTAELAGYMQAAVVQMTDDVSTADNAGLTQALADIEGMQSVVQTTVQNSTVLTDAPNVDENSAQASQKSEILTGEATENDFAETVQTVLAENADVTTGNTLQSKVTDTSYNADKGISDSRIDMTVSEEAANSGYPGETDIKATAYKADDHTAMGKPEENIAGESANITDISSIAGESEPEGIAVADRFGDIATDGKSNAVNSGNKAVDLNVAGKTDAVAGAKAQKDIVKMAFEKTADTVTNETKQEITAGADNVPRVAYAKRNVEVKSDELKAITKGTEVTKSDSDLDTEQKVTDKNAVSDMNARSADVFAKAESRFDEDGQPAQTVRVPISDMASFVSEHAPKSTGKSTLTVVLTPETLGKITVRMVNESGKLTVEILTETQAAKELLQVKSEQLAYALRNDDVELTSYKVETSQAELFQRDFDGSSKNPYRQQSHDRHKNDADDFDSLLGEIQAMS